MKKLKLNFKFAAYSLVLAAISAAHAGSYEDFFIAVTRDNGGTIESLLQRGFDPNTRNADGQTGLIIALRDDSLKAANAILQGPGLDVNATNKAGESALMMAALRGQTEQVQQLLQRGAKLDLPGWTPLHYAATGPRTDLVKLLLDKGAPINAESPNRSTPLMMAARYGAENSVDQLLARGADITLRNEQGLTAVDFARLGGREALTTRLGALLAQRQPK